MPFLFSNPISALLLPAIALPIIFHLFFRLRKQVREFPSLMFFLRIDPKLSAKRKIHEWIILFLRCLFIALLILALTRVLIGLKGSSEKVARLVLIDNSGSMAGPAGDGINKLTLAERAAVKMLGASRPGDSFAVQTMLPDPTVNLPRGFDATPAVLVDALGKLTPTDGAAPVTKAIRSALALLDTARAPQHELHIVTDLQQKNWSRGDIGTDAARMNCRVIVHRIATAPIATGSVSLEMPKMPDRSIPAGRLTLVRVKLQNNTAVAAHVRLNSSDDSGKNFSQELNVGPNASAPVTLTFSFPSAGFHSAQVWIEGDASAMSNHAALGFLCTEPRKALFVGAKDDFGALPYAISPGGNANLSGIEAAFTDANQLAAGLADKPLAVILTWDNFPSAAPALQDYLRLGGTLIVVPAQNPAVAAATNPDWLGASIGTLQTVKTSEPLVLLHETDPLWQDLLGADGRPKLGALRTFQYRPLKADGWDKLVTSSNGAPLLARKSWGHGQVYVSGLAFTPKWSSFPLRASFVVLVQNMVFGRAEDSVPVKNGIAGDDYKFGLGDVAASVKSIAGTALDWHGQPHDFAGLPRTGVYQISQGDKVSWAAMSSNPDEADGTFLPLATVPLIVDLPHDIQPLAQENDLARLEAAHAASTSLFRWLLLMALLVLLLETWVANERSSDWGRSMFETLRKATPASKKSAKSPVKPVKKLTPV